MSDYAERLEQQMRRKYPWTGYRYKPMMQSSPEKEALSEQFLRSLEEEGDEEGVYKRFLKKGLRQPGTTKSRVEAYLRRVLEKAEEEGRI